jgi:hypothetical protein
MQATTPERSSAGNSVAAYVANVPSVPPGRSRPCARSRPSRTALEPRPRLSSRHKFTPGRSPDHYSGGSDSPNSPPGPPLQSAGRSMVAKGPEAGSRRTCISTTDRRGRGAQYVHPHIGCARSLRLLDGPVGDPSTGTVGPLGCPGHWDDYFVTEGAAAPSITTRLLTQAPCGPSCPWWLQLRTCSAGTSTGPRRGSRLHGPRYTEG